MIESLLLAAILAYFLWSRYRESEVVIRAQDAQMRQQFQYALPPNQAQQRVVTAPPQLVYGN